MVCDAPSLSRRDTAQAVAPERTVTVILTQVTCADKVSGTYTEKRRELAPRVCTKDEAGLRETNNSAIRFTEALQGSTISMEENHQVEEGVRHAAHLR